MSALDMAGFIDDDFANVIVTITPVDGGYLDGEFIQAASTSTEHRATKQNASTEELAFLASGGERSKSVARFFINDGSVHSVGSTLVDDEGNEYRIVDADCRPSRNYCRLLGASKND